MVAQKQAEPPSSGTAPLYIVSTIETVSYFARTAFFFRAYEIGQNLSPSDCIRLQDAPPDIIT